MLDHITIGVGDIERLYAEGAYFAGHGIKPKGFSWTGQRDAPQTSVHVAFTAKDRVAVDRLHATALAAGG